MAKDHVCLPWLDKRAPEKHYKDALSEISCNVLEIMRSPNLVWRFFWTILWIVLILAFSTQSYYLIRTYLTVEIVTVHRTVFHESLPYPKITLCNENWMSAKAWKEFEKLNETARLFIASHFEPTHTLFWKQSYEAVRTNFHVEAGHADFDMLDFWRENHINVEDWIVMCSAEYQMFSGRDCVSKIKTKLFYYQGQTCVTLDFIDAFNQTIARNYNTMMRLVFQQTESSSLFPCTFNYKLPQQQCIWSLHFSAHSNPFPMKLNSMTYIYPAKFQIIVMDETFQLQEFLPASYGDCTEDVHYSMEICEQQIFMQEMKNCGKCYPFGYVYDPGLEKADGVRACSPIDYIQCHQQVRQNVKRCVPSCYSTKFDLKVSKRRFDISPAATGGSSLVPTMSRSQLDRTAGISIFNSDSSITYSKDVPKVTHADLISKLGAALSIWFGLKITSFFQIIYFTGWAIKRRLDHKNEVEQVVLDHIPM